MGGLILAAGALIGGRGGLFIALLIALGVNGFAYFNSDKLALRAMRAFPVTETAGAAAVRDRARAGDRGPPADAAALREPHQPAQRLRDRPQPAQRRGLRHPGHPRAARPRASCAACSAHELSHVYNRDILICSVAGAMATVITYLAHMAMFASLFGGRSDDRERRQRVRRPAADRSWARSPPGWCRWRSAGAASTRPTPRARSSPGTRWRWPAPCARSSAGAAALPLPQDDRLVTQSHLMIANPFRGQGLATLFSTHPPMAERIARLEGMARELGTALTAGRR